jgi:hypothetical protein
MTKKVVNKKLIVTTNFRGQNESKLGKSFNTLQSNMAANPDIVPTISPMPDVVAIKISTRQALITTGGTLRAQLKQNTEDINSADTELKSIFTDQWATQIQNTPGITLNQIKALSFGAKGFDSGHSAGESAGTTASSDKGAGSAPVIAKITQAAHLEHIVHIVNNITGKIGHPDNILRTDVYGQTDGPEPIDLAALIANGGGYLGTAKRGKYISQLNAASIGSIEYYIVVYVDKKTLKPVAQSPVVDATII